MDKFNTLNSHDFSRTTAMSFQDSKPLAVLSVRLGVGVALLLAHARADKRGPKAPFPLVENAGIQTAIRKRVPAGTPAGAGSYWKDCIRVANLAFCFSQTELSPRAWRQLEEQFIGEMIKRQETKYTVTTWLSDTELFTCKHFQVPKAEPLP